MSGIVAAGASGGSRPVFKLPALLDLRAATSLKLLLLAHLKGRKEFVLDAADVSRLSTACVQVIVSFVIAARRESATVCFVNCSPYFRQCFDLLGLRSILAEEPQ